MNATQRQSHLSIGEVLSLVQQDFPDVTISKIRFLESQGLIAPERTASGFRKFYDRDIDRLRWILRQQSDHFLPLKVIKKMLDDGLDAAGSEIQQTLWTVEADSAQSTGPDGKPTVGVSSEADAAQVSAASSAGGDHSSSAADVDATPSDTSGNDASGSDPQDGGKQSTADPRSSSQPATKRKPSPTHPSVVSAAMARQRAASGTAAPQPSPGNPSSTGNSLPAGDSSPTGSSTTRDSVVSGATGEAAGVSDLSTEAERDDSTQSGSSTRGPLTPADIVAALQEDPRPKGSRTARSDGGGVTSPWSHLDPTFVDGVHPRGDFSVEALTESDSGSDLLSADEVCEMFDLEASALEDLEKFGLVAPRRFGGTVSYDKIDLEIIGMAARYASLGVEARHLRMYKISAEREAGFIEQLVVPILKQRNPTAKERATEQCSQLATMGDELHSLILRRHLRNLFRGR